MPIAKDVYDIRISKFRFSRSSYKNYQKIDWFIEYWSVPIAIKKIMSNDHNDKWG